MRKVTKILLEVLMVMMLIGTTVSANEYTVTDTNAVLWTNASTVIKADASADAAAVLPSMEIGTPVHITGVTSNGYWRVEINGATYYIEGSGLGDTIVTNEYIRKYYDKPVIVNQKGVTIEIDYTEWSLRQNSKSMFRIGYTVTNNTPYTLDVFLAKGDGAKIYNGYTDDTSTKKSNVFTFMLEETEQNPTLDILTGESKSGFQTFNVTDYELKDNQIARFTAEYFAQNSISSFVQFKPVTFYDYTTAETRLECDNLIRYSVDF